MSLEVEVAQLLINKRKSLSVAESCTGGLISHRLTNVPGCSKFLMVSLVNYSDESKVQLLKVPATLIKRNGAVSAQVAATMAQNVRKLLKTDFGLAVTGIAGPGGGSKRKPVGLTYIALADKSKSHCKKFLFQGTRHKVKKQAANQALSMLVKIIIRT